MSTPDAIGPIESLSQDCTRLRIHLYASPRASRTRAAGLHDGRLKVQVAAPPVDGEANEAILAYLAHALGVGRSHVRLTAGQSGKRKTVEVEGVSAWDAAQALGLATQGAGPAQG